METIKKKMDGLSAKFLAAFIDGYFGLERYNAMSEEQKTFIQLGYLCGLNSGLNVVLGWNDNEPFSNEEIEQIRDELGPYLQHQIMASGRLEYIQSILNNDNGTETE